MKQEFITVVVVEPKKPARIEIIRNELSVLQRLVGGYIECVRMGGYDIIINEEGKLSDLEPNFAIHGGGDYIAGTAVFVGVDLSEGEFKSLSDGQVKFIKGTFKGRE